MRKIITLLLFITFLTGLSAKAQEASLLPQKALEKTGRYYDQLVKHINGMNNKVLRRAARFERKMYRRLVRKDPALAKRLFSVSSDSLTAMRKWFPNYSSVYGNTYFPGIDTMKNAMMFLQQEYPIAALRNPAIEKNLSAVKALQSRFSQSGEIKSYLQERKEVLVQKLSVLAGFSKQLKKYRQELDGYMQGVQEWRNLLNNPKAIEEKALALIKRTGAFQKFMQQHSELAQLFGNVGGSSIANTNSNPGLQTRAAVTARLQNTLAAGGPNAQAVLQQQIGIAQQQLSRLKAQTIGSGNAAEMPAYGAKTMKYKRFIQRLEPGANIQFSKSNRFFPSTADMAVQLAYKISEKGSIGMGTSYKLGFGTGWNDIRFTAQGLGLRGFADFKLKGSFFINGGFEQNRFQPGNPVMLPQKGNGAFWASSALLGISKKFSAGKKLNASAALLYDFLFRQTPGAQPIKYRMGYYFK